MIREIWIGKMEYRKAPYSAVSGIIKDSIAVKEAGGTK